MGKVAAGGQAVPHLHMDNREEQVGSDTHYATQSSGTGKQSLKTSSSKNLWGLQGWEKLPVSQESFWRDPQGPRTYRSSSTQESAPEGPICLWVVGEVTESQPRAKQAALFLLGPLLYIQHHNAATWVAPPW